MRSIAIPANAIDHEKLVQRSREHSAELWRLRPVAGKTDVHPSILPNLPFPAERCWVTYSAASARMTHSYQAAFREFGYAPQKSLYVERDPRSDEIEMTGPAVKFLSNPTAAVSPGEVIPQPLEDFEVVPEGLLDYR